MLTLNATIRHELGKKTKKLRSEGKLPAVIYGRKIKSTPIALGYKNFDSVYKEAGETTLVSLNLENHDESIKETPRENVVLIRDVEINPITRLYMHVDFHQVPLDEEIEIEVPIAFISESPAVKSQEGVLVRNLYEIGVRALPKDLPRDIGVDLSVLEKVGDALTVKDLKAPTGVKFVADEDLTVVLIAVREEEEIAPVEEAAVAPVAEIKTEGEEKREERAKEKQEAQSE